MGRASPGGPPAGRPLKRAPAPAAPAATVAAFAIAAPGLESLVAAELDRLGIPGTVEPGGVAWIGPMASVQRANFWLRTASRVLVRVSEFRARTFWELERHAKRLPWEQFANAGVPVRFRVTSRKSRLYHTDAIAERFTGAAVTSVGATTGRSGSAAGTADDDDGYDEDDDEGQLFVVRIVRDVCTVSVDASGRLLHRRGYRQAVGKAPLRETIASAMLLGSDWRGRAPLLDPMCGSGTIPIEAALMARRIAPGLSRSFAFQRWRTFDEAGWMRMVEAARRDHLTRAPVPIQGSDRDAGAIEAARANAERAGVAADVEFSVRALSGIEPPAAAGWVVTNPPYGARVGESASVRDLYAALGKVLRERCGGWTLAMLSPGDALDRQVGLSLHVRFATSNGGIPVRLVSGQVPK